MRVATNGTTLDVDVRGVDTGRAGAPPALVFLHFFGGSSRTWAEVAGRLEDDFPCVIPSLRGWGGSPATPAGYTVADMADDVAGLIEALGLRRYVLVGHSMGGKAAFALAARRPAGLVALVLVAPSPPSPEPIADEERARLLASFGDRAAVEETVRGITAAPLAPVLFEHTVADALCASRPAWNAWLNAGSREDLTHLAPRVAVPTLVVAGRTDTPLTPAVLERTVTARIASARQTVIEAAGHGLPLEAADALAGLIRAHAAGGGA